MNNLHLSMTNVKNASRLFKQTKSLLAHNVFDKIFVVGLGEENLKEQEILSEGQVLWRIPLWSRRLGNNIFIQGFKYIEYAVRILLKYRKKNIKVVTSHGLDTLLLGCLFKLFYNVKLVYDAHELETEKNGLTGFRKKVSKLVERRLIGYVDEIFVVSDSIVKDYSKRYGIDPPHLVMNCPQAIEAKKTNYFRKKFNIHPSAIIYIYQGGLFSNRGIELILDTFKSLDNKKRVVIFMGYGGLQKEINKYAKMYKTIYFHPAVPAEVVLEYTASADVGISVLVFKGETNLSYYYCLPNKFFEYLMVGLPILCSDIPEMRAILEMEKVGVLLNENSSSALLKSIEEIEKLDFTKIKEKGKKILKIFNWEEQEKILISVYKKILNGG